MRQSGRREIRAGASGGVEFRQTLEVPPRSRVTTVVYGYFPEEPLGVGEVAEQRVPPIAMAEWHSVSGSGSGSDSGALFMLGFGGSTTAWGGPMTSAS